MSQKNEKKGKSQIGINWAIYNKPNEFIHRIRAWTSYLPVGKTENSSGEMQRLQMNLPRECGLISLLIPIWLFPFVIFLRQRYCN